MFGMTLVTTLLYYGGATFTVAYIGIALAFWARKAYDTLRRK